MKKERLYFLFQKRIQRNLTDDEARELESYIDDPLMHHGLQEFVSDEFNRPDADYSLDLGTEVALENLEKSVWLRIEKAEESKVRKVRPYWRHIAAGVAVFLAIGIGAYYHTFRNNSIEENVFDIAQDDIVPGTNRATLVLSDGNRIDLNEEKIGIQVLEDRIYYEDGTLVMDHTLEKDVTLIVPRAGQYQLTLSDGTKVWLNAATTFKYPTHFQGNQRVVDLIGEAYFEVKPDAQRPFLVRSNGQTIRVLGTAFNVNAYPEEPNIITTLVEGSIALSPTNGPKEMILKPGEQALLSSDRMDIKSVDVGPYIGWKNGLIIFEQADLLTITRQIERWYDVSFDLPVSHQTEKVYGEVSRDANLSEILYALQLNYNVKFKREGRRVIMSR